MQKIAMHVTINPIGFFRENLVEGSYAVGESKYSGHNGRWLKGKTEVVVEVDKVLGSQRRNAQAGDPGTKSAIGGFVSSWPHYNRFCYGGERCVVFG